MIRRTLFTLTALATVNVCQAAVISVTTVEQLDKILAENKAVIVDFYASWCGPCKNFAPTFEKASNQITDTVFIKVDVDLAKALTKKYGIRSMPTLVGFKNGTKIFTESGGKSLSKLRALADKLQ